MKIGNKITSLKNFRPTWTEIDLANLAHNYFQIKKAVAKNVKILVAVKADAYGHGMIEVSRKLIQCKVDYLGVASMDEALSLRNAKINTSVLVMGVIFSKEEIDLALRLNITLTLTDYAMAQKIARHIPEGKRLKVHIKVDTGMGRLGMWHENAVDEIMKIKKIKNFFIEGVYTHFPSADEDIKYTRKQIAAFERLISCLKEKNMHVALTHAANSIATCRLKTSHMNMVRPGIMLYGMHPRPGIGKIRLKPVLSLKTKIAYLKDVDPGRTISYGRTYIAKKKTSIATLPIGYADGYLRALSNKAKVIIRGKLYPIAGRICMDQTMVDVGHASKVKPGDEVIIIGQKKQLKISAEELGFLCDTIPYEITCGISNRVLRIFKNV